MFIASPTPLIGIKERKRIKREEMQKISFNLAKFKRPEKNRSEEEALCDEIYEYFGKPKKFYSLVRLMAQEKGMIFVREVFEQVKKGNDIKDRKAVFLYRVLSQKII